MSAKSLTPDVCIAVKSGAVDVRHRGCAYPGGKGTHMLMFSRTQLYIGLGLAALVEIAIVARFIIH
jgi:hypothetical protein